MIGAPRERTTRLRHRGEARKASTGRAPMEFSAGTALLLDDREKSAKRRFGA